MNSERMYTQVEVDALLRDERARLVELEGIDKACDAANQHVLSLQADLDKVRAELSRERAQGIREALEDERSKVAMGVAAVEKAIRAYEWLLEGRGFYGWNDDRWYEEFGYACASIRKALEPLKKIGGDLSNRILTPSNADAARERERKMWEPEVKTKKEK